MFHMGRGVKSVTALSSTGIYPYKCYSAVEYTVLATLLPLKVYLREEFGREAVGINNGHVRFDQH